MLTQLLTISSEPHKLPVQCRELSWDVFRAITERFWISALARKHFASQFSLPGFDIWMLTSPRIPKFGYSSESCSRMERWSARNMILQSIVGKGVVHGRPRAWRQKFTLSAPFYWCELCTDDFWWHPLGGRSGLTRRIIVWLEVKFPTVCLEGSCGATDWVKPVSWRSTGCLTFAVSQGDACLHGWVQLLGQSSIVRCLMSVLEVFQLVMMVIQRDILRDMSGQRMNGPLGRCEHVGKIILRNVWRERWPVCHRHMIVCLS